MTRIEGGVTVVNDDFFRGIACMSGLVSTHEIPVADTNAEALMHTIELAGGFGFAVTRTINPGIGSYQRGIDGVTGSPWGHSVMLIGEKIGRLARLARPGLMIKQPSPRWKNSPTHPNNIGRGMRITDTTDGRPVPWIGGISKDIQKLEIVESQLYVAVNSLTAAIDKGEQIIVFVNPNWTTEQKVAMAVEAYSWVGEFYDVFEIAKYVFPLAPNPRFSKVCSTLVLECIAAGDASIRDWCRNHGLDPEMIAPRDVFRYGVDLATANFSFRCKFEDALKA